MKKKQVDPVAFLTGWKATKLPSGMCILCSTEDRPAGRIRSNFYVTASLDVAERISTALNQYNEDPDGGN